jgi:hypothetical protein
MASFGYPRCQIVAWDHQQLLVTNKLVQTPIALLSQIASNFPWLCSSPCEYSLIKCINCHIVGKDPHSNNTFLQNKQTLGATDILLLHEVSITCIHKVHNLEQQKVLH